MTAQAVLDYLGGSIISLAIAYLYWSAYRNPNRNAATRFIYGFTSRLRSRWWNPDLQRQLLAVCLVCLAIGVMGLALFLLKLLGIQYEWGPH